ncbi:beta/alpha barrel domain-containing protein [Anditalea andensis]|uniref:Phosphoribosylanthranilate isomerase n=1 Tax=Anditalea andensis TaxID=1048983 RepID=A0A074L2A4_9BACT|nr:phosphoribosylanthranilate isomerase [Anditalea andensis]KEO74003.1 phosphoribosylanthranilate isomerase [Anditalea andensis]
MALKTFVKISNVNNLSDARYCAGMYVNIMGFSLEEQNENHVTPQKFKEITDWISGVEFVAEFQSTHPERILTTLKDYEGFTFIQIEEESHIQLLMNTSYSLIWKTKLNNIVDFDYYIGIAKSLKEGGVTLLIDSDELTLDLNVIKKIDQVSRFCDVLVGFDIDQESVQRLLNESLVKGISLKGGNEIKPGFKDFDGLADILELLEVED